jgi:DNA-binding beta-propeller fold protein YncE
MVLFIIIITLLLTQNTLWADMGKELYQQHCASCHHAERYGTTAPPLIPETIGKKKDAELISAIIDGLLATNMPSFKDVLSAKDAEGLVKYIKGPVGILKWDERDILQSKVINNNRSNLLAIPSLDYSNFFMIVEAGTGSVHFMDGDTFKILDKVKIGAIHGGPKYDYEFKNAYVVSRDGWILKYDLRTFNEIGRIRAGINTRNIAISKDGRHIAVANALPKNIVILDAKSLEPVKIINTNETPNAVYTLKKKGLFVAASRESGYIWFINYKDNFNVEKVTATDRPFSDFFIDPNEQYLIGAFRGGGRLSVFDIGGKRVIKDVELSGMPHLASAAFWKERGKTYAAFPHIGEPVLTVVELYNWEIKANIKLKGSGFFARTHDKSPYIWVDTGTDTIQLIDKKSLTVVKEIVPEDKKWSMHVEFTKDGRYAFVSIRETDGAVVIYDTVDLKEIKRIPFVKPVGKYNATNKTG